MLERPVEAAAAAARGIAIEPDSTVVAYIAGGASFWIRDYENADRYTRQAIELERDAAFPQWIRSLLLSRQGQHDAAIEAAERAAAVGQRQPLLLSGLGAAYGRAGRLADAQRNLEELLTPPDKEYVAPMWAGDICVRWAAWTTRWSISSAPSTSGMRSCCGWAPRRSTTPYAVIPVSTCCSGE
jgi:tetratricopeptide (TPR) repeat protein